MKKNKYIWLIGILVVATLVVAQGISNNNRSLGIDPARYDALEELNLISYKTSDTVEGNIVERCLYKNLGNTTKRTFQTCRKFKLTIRNCTEMADAYNGTRPETPIIYCKTYEELPRPTQEVRDEINAWEEKRMNEIADVKIGRNNRPSRNQMGNGTTNITRR